MKPEHTKFGYSKISDESDFSEELEKVVDKYAEKLTYAQVIGVFHIYLNQLLKDDDV